MTPQAPNGATADGARVLAWAARLLLALAAVRALAFATHDPLVALANNFDMVRVEGCIEAYPMRPGVHPWTMSYDRPLERYAFRDDAPHPCYATSEALLVFAAWPVLALEARSSEDGGFALRTLGLVKLGLLLALAFAFGEAYLRAGSPRIALAHAAMVLLVLLDPAISLYASGFYMEFSAVLGLYATLAIAVLLALRDRQTWAWSVAFGAAVAFLVMSKVQHAFLGLVVAGVLAVVWLAYRGSARAAIVAGIAGFAAMLAQVAHLGSDEVRAIQGSSRTNIALYTVLASSRDPGRTAELIGLPRGCAAHAGKNWFTPGLADAHPCPEVWAMSRFDAVALAWRDPATFAAVLRGGLDRIRPWVPDYLGKVAQQPLAPLPEHLFTWSRPLDRLPQAAVDALLVLPALLALLFLVGRRVGRAEATGYALLAWLPWPIFAAALFGDGYIDVPKHAHLAFACVLAFWLLAAGHALMAMAGRRVRPEAADAAWR